MTVEAGLAGREEAEHVHITSLIGLVSLHTHRGVSPVQGHPPFLPRLLRGGSTIRLHLVAYFGVWFISLPSCFVQTGFSFADSIS